MAGYLYLSTALTESGRRGIERSEANTPVKMTSNRSMRSRLKGSTLDATGTQQLPRGGKVLLGVRVGREAALWN
jgi:hypothetical protein